MAINAVRKIPTDTRSSGFGPARRPMINHAPSTKERIARTTVGL